MILSVRGDLNDASAAVKTSIDDPARFHIATRILEARKEKKEEGEAMPRKSQVGCCCQPPCSSMPVLLADARTSLAIAHVLLEKVGSGVEFFGGSLSAPSIFPLLALLGRACLRAGF